MHIHYSITSVNITSLYLPAVSKLFELVFVNNVILECSPKSHIFSPLLEKTIQYGNVWRES